MRLDSNTWDPRLRVWRLYLRYREALGDAPYNACSLLLYGVSAMQGARRYCARCILGTLTIGT